MSNLKMPKRLLSKSGFTLVELMVVVAIIGILAAVAIPNYQKYQARARQSEAKVMLASAYTALQSYFAEVGTYTTCLNDIGFESTAGAKRYYTVGINDPAVATCGPAGNASCNAYTFDNAGAAQLFCGGAAADPAAVVENETHYVATAALGGVVLPVAALAVVGNSPSDINQTVFVVTAVGRVSSAPAVPAAAAAGNGGGDRWTIDQAKTLNNGQNGV